MKRILLVKTSSLGDVIHNCAVVNDILQHHPTVKIDWLVEENFADIPRLHPAIHQVFTVAVRRWRKHLFALKTWQEIYRLKQALQQNTYDAVIDTQGLIKSACLARLARGPKHGYDKYSIRESVASFFYDQTYAIAYDQHAVVRNRTLVAMSLGDAPPPNRVGQNFPDYGLQAPKVTLSDFNIPKTPFVMGLHGTSKSSKLWPETHWVNLALLLEAQQMALVLPWSDESEHQRAKRIAAQTKNTFILPKLSIQTLAGIIAQANAAVGMDTGLSHLSAALNIPTTAIYVDTNPQRTGVMAGSVCKAINLGGKNQLPSAENVIDAIRSIT